VLQLVSAGFLGIALYKIKKQLKSVEGNEMVDVGILMLDLFACLLYVLSSGTLYFYLGCFYLFSGNLQLVYVLSAISNILAFVQ
jgi:hypothetical protein